MGKLFMILVCLFSCSGLFAHGQVHGQIVVLTDRINRSEQPDTDLFMKRGRLYMEDNHLEAARGDFNHVIELQPTSRSALYYLGEIALNQSEYDIAVNFAERFIDSLAGEKGALVRGYKLLGAAYMASEQFSLAAESYEVVLNITTNAVPNDYLNLANTLHKSNNHELALTVLTRGIEKLGSLSVLEQQALAIELGAKDHKAALARMDRIIAQGKQLPFLYEQKGNILQDAGEVEEAYISYRQALVELEKLPASRRDTPAIKALARKIRLVLN